MKDTSVVIVTYFTGPVLRMAIASILEQAGLGELVIVDNGNPAQETDELRALASADARVRLLSGHGNVGFARGCNMGAAQAGGEYLFFVNPDCILPSDALQKMLAAAAQLPDASILAPLIFYPDGQEQSGTRREVLTPWRALVEWGRLYKLAPNHPYFQRFNLRDTAIPEQLSPVDVTSGAAMFMHRELFDELQGFDEGFFLHVEDIDLCVRLLRLGGSAYVNPAVHVTHYVSSSAASPLRTEWHKANGFRRYFRKHFEGKYPRGLLPLVNTAVMVRYLISLPALLYQHFAAHRNTRFSFTAQHLEPPS